MLDILPATGNVIHGGMFVIEGEGEVLRVRDLVRLGQPCVLHGPDGPVSVTVEPAATSCEDVIELMAEDSTGNGFCFMLSPDQIQLTDYTTTNVEEGRNYPGKALMDNKLVDANITILSLKLRNTRGVDCYTMTDATVYVGAGLQKTFLPFRVYNESNNIRIQ